MDAPGMVSPNRQDTNSWERESVHLLQVSTQIRSTHTNAI
jgi:hypothetical protein